MSISEYRPLDFLIGSHAHDSKAAPALALLILNTPLPELAILRSIWANTSYHLCADGGANRLYDLFSFSSHLEQQRSNYLPTEIHGDLDSLRPDVRHYYSTRGVTVSHDADQETTDFAKAIHRIHQRRPTPPPPGAGAAHHDILILGSLSGRVDHGLGLLSQLYREQYRNANTRLWLFSESSISFILEAGTSIISCEVESGLITRNVGIIPVWGPAVISTMGLQWDVKGWRTEMGGRVSTSNHVEAGRVEVYTDKRVLFTVERVVDLDE